eukprot:Rhum_TRINITY_DN2495_c0_g1::Rhum_TRINITY_DN2495_c0_g1_i1::g.7305::m.7305
MQRLALQEYYQWRLSKRLQYIAFADAHPRSQARVRKAVEKFCTSSYDPRGGYPKLYSRCSGATSQVAQKLRSDMAAAGLPDAEARVQRMLDEITKERQKGASGGLVHVPITSNRSSIQMGKFKTEVTERTRLLTGMTGVEAVAAMLLRYRAAMAESTNWSIPPSVYEILRTELGCNAEGFASPINSYLLPYQGGKYCSLFGDLDQHFNSKGSVWDVTNPSRIAQGWVLNPPFTLYHLNKASNLARGWMADDPTLRVVLVGRSHDAHAHSSSAPQHSGKVIQASSPYAPLRPYTQASIALPPHEHYYQTPRGAAVTATFPSSLYICGPPLHDATVVDRIREAFAVSAA